MRIAVIGSGPAGVYAADMLTKSEEVRAGLVVSIDLCDRYPAPYGLIRFVAPEPNPAPGAGFFVCMSLPDAIRAGSFDNQAPDRGDLLSQPAPSYCS